MQDKSKMQGLPFAEKRRAPRARLEQLEPRVSPTALLFSVPVVGAMLDAFARRDEEESRYSDFADDGESTLAAQLEGASEPQDFSPAMLSQLGHPAAAIHGQYEAVYPAAVSSHESSWEDEGALASLAPARDDGQDRVDMERLHTALARVMGSRLTRAVPQDQISGPR